MIAFHILAIFSSLIWPYLFSHYATFATERISHLGDAVYNTDWFDFPIDLQKCFVLIMAKSQEDVHFTGLNLVGCTLEIFGKVFDFYFHVNIITFFPLKQLMSTSCSYYMIFRRF